MLEKERPQQQHVAEADVGFICAVTKRSSVLTAVAVTEGKRSVTGSESLVDVHHVTYGCREVLHFLDFNREERKWEGSSRASSHTVASGLIIKKTKQTVALRWMSCHFSSVRKDGWFSVILTFMKR